MNHIADLLQVNPEPRNAHCPQHGPYQSRNVISKTWSKCPACEKLRADQTLLEQQAAELEAATERWSRLQQSAAIPERFWNRELTNFKTCSPAQDRALKFAIDFAGSFALAKNGRCAIFTGRPGTGKTHLAVGIAHAVMRDHHKLAVFVTVQQLFRNVRDTWRKGAGRSESDVIEGFVMPDLLILDEVGIQNGTESERNILFDLLNARYERRKSTLLLTNKTVEECISFVGERVIDRMREDGGQVIPFDWGSHRKQLGGENNGVPHE